MSRSILHVLGTAQLEGTGIARIVASLARGLKTRDYLVHACFLGDSGPLVRMLEDAGVPTRALHLKGRNLSGAFRLWSALRRSRFAVIHQHAGGPLISRITGWATGAPMVLHLHGRVTESRQSEPEPIHIRRADFVIASSYSVAQMVTAATPAVVYTGVPVPDSFPVKPVEPPGRRMIIGTGCRLAPIKGIPNLVRALGLLHGEFPDARLEIAGEGPERGNIVDLADELGLQNCVTLLGWRSDFPSMVANWDIFAIPSVEESLPVAVLEAMAAGLPVIASAVGGLPEVVQQGETGWLVPPSKPERLAERLRYLLLHPEERIRMGHNARNRVRSHFSEDRMVAQIAEVYGNLIQRRGKGFGA